METSSNALTPQYSIGTVARMLGITESTLRLYERRGLLLTCRSDGGQRLYSPSDVERIKCIRDAINVHKISIEGIRRMQSMVPCWEVVRCPMEQRLACRAYTDSEAGCWTHKHTSNVCEQRECLNCQVYLAAGDCAGIKALVHHRALVPEKHDDQSHEGTVG